MATLSASQCKAVHKSVVAVTRERVKTDKHF